MRTYIGNRNDLVQSERSRINLLGEMESLYGFSSALVEKSPVAELSNLVPA